MNINKKELINKIYNIIFTIFTIILGFLFILFTCTIYYSAKNSGSYQIYNVEIISKYWGYLIIPVILWILLIIFGIVFYFIFPLKKKINKPDEIETYYKLKKRIPLNDEKYLEQLNLINKERKIRSIVFIGISLVCLLFMILPAKYLFNFDNFSSNKPIEAINMATNVFPWIIGAFILFAAYLFYFSISIKKELSIIREILKTYKGKPVNNKKDYSLITNITRIGILVVGITFLIIGIVNGGPSEVLDKAIKICMECIGIA